MSLLAVRIRSGLVETFHQGAVAAVSSDGELVAWSGEVERPFFLRSAAKPFQALVAQEEGADLDPVRLAVAVSSHDGDPVRVALVEAMLAEAGLGPDHLRCPPAWPLSLAARDRLVAAGKRRPRRQWHNCSGKHAAWLRACLARGWPVETYLDPGHPLQTRIIDLVSELGGMAVEPVGVDGCGAPVLRTNAVAMARLYARLGGDPRLEPVYVVMHRYPALVSGTGNGDSALSTALDAVAKRGAAGCLGMARRHGHGLAVKAWDGLDTAAEVGAVAALTELESLSGHLAGLLAAVGRPPVLGGGETVGEWEPRLELQRT